jgi:hypothetical membrane protein
MNRKELLGATAWVLTLQFFVVQGVVQAAWTTPFSLAHNMISDLARVTCGPLHRAPGIDVACSPWHALMNVSIILNGFLIPAGAYFTRAAWPAGRGMTIALAMIALTAPGHVAVGVFPSDTSPSMHVLGAGIILALGNPGIVSAGLALWRSRRALAIVSLVLGLGGIAGTLLFLFEIGSGVGLGGMERVAFYPLPLWCGVTGLSLLRRRAARGQGNEV